MMMRITGCGLAALLSTCMLFIGTAHAQQAPPAVSGPFINTFTGHDQQHFAYLAQNGEIWDAFYCPGCSGNKWKLQKINSGGVTDGPLALIGVGGSVFVNTFTGHDQQHFVYTAIGAEIWDAFYCARCIGDKWKLQKINSGGVTDGSRGGSPFVNTFVGHDQQHFAYLGTGGVIWDAFYSAGDNSWHLQKIN